MKIALLGYGKMGKAIEEIALERGHDISLKVSSRTREFININSFLISIFGFNFIYLIICF